MFFFIPVPERPHQVPESVAMDPDNYLHGDGEKHDHSNTNPEPERDPNKKYPKSGTFDLEAALHGTEGHGSDDVHSADNTHDDPVQEGKRAKFGTYDPDILLHGGKCQHVSLYYQYLVFIIV